MKRLLAALFLGLAVPAAASPMARGPHSSVTLVSESAAVPAGADFRLGLLFRLAPGWHVYWKNPGDSGTSPAVSWKLPPGFSAGPLLWPVPKRIELPPLANFGYEGEALLPVEATPPPGLKAGARVRLSARVDWLVCKVECLPASGTVSLELPVARAARADPRWAKRFESALDSLPAAAPEWRVSARSAAGAVELSVSAPPGREVPEGLFFFPEDGLAFRHAAAQALGGTRRAATLSIPLAEEAPSSPARLVGALAAAGAWDAAGRRRGLAVDTPIEARAALLASAGLAFLGGLLLNLMPCVFPVLSLKVLGFLRAGGPAALRAHSLLYSAGVLASFWVLAGALLLLRAGGAQLGWGFQLQSQPFVAGLCLLFFALGLHLAGVFEVGASLTRLGGLGAGRGGGGAFLSGALAVLAATPCTAPFMGTALGYALARPAAEAMLVFTALGAGMAAPTLLLSLRPGLLAFMPKPGAWMETLKQALAFPLFATAAWLFWVFDRQAGPDAAARLLAALLLCAAAAWTLGRWSGRGGRLSGLALLAAAVFAAAAGAGALSRSAAGDAAGVAWEAFSPERLSELRRTGPVFVDFTADWCLTCQVNERLALSVPSVAEAFAASGVAALKADWTSRDPEITRELASLGRAGVPAYALYPAGKGAPTVLPALLTPGIVKEALARAGGSALQSKKENKP